MSQVHAGLLSHYSDSSATGLLYYHHAATPSVTALQQTDLSSQFTLICTSTTSPATTVVWTKDGTTLSFGGTPYQHSQVVTDRRSSTYDNILTSTGDLASSVGYYTCTVSNRFGSNSQGLQVRGWFTHICCFCSTHWI